MLIGVGSVILVISVFWLFAESVVALDAKTGKRVWHYQIVHHGLWDYDLPAPPVLATITWNGRPRDVVAVPSKTAWIYVFGVAGAVGGTVTRGGLIFATGGGDVLYALDTRDGRVLWQFALPAGRGYSNPVSYRAANGVQYLVMATGGGDNSELVAFSLGGAH